MSGAHLRSFVIGTDWWTDCDDVAAIRLVARMHKAGHIRLLGICLDACMEDSAASLSAFLTYEGLPDMPIGLDRNANDFGRRAVMYQNRMAQGKHSLENDGCEEAVTLYRRLLAAADEPVELIEIGYPQVLAALLQSSPDAHSPLDGMALVKEKVTKLWMMAGNWENGRGRENNFCRNERSRVGGAFVCAHWPTPITFLGWEVGASVLSGGQTLSDGRALPPDDPLALAYADIGCSNGRSSWDPMLCLLACIGDEASAGYDIVRGTASVDAVSGENAFTPSDDGAHGYVIKRYRDADYSRAIDAWL